MNRLPHWIGRAFLALCVATLAACGSLPAAPERAPVRAEATDPHTPLATIAAASGPSGTQTGARLLPLGAYSLDARLQLAERAQRSLVVQYYQFEDDATGRRLLQALRDAGLRGVQVRVLVDDLYTARSQRLLLALSKTPNTEVRLYNPFCCNRHGVLSRFLASPHEFGRLNHRMHNKLFAADGAMAVVGGRNIADDYFLLGSAQNFIDMDALLVGPVLQQLQAVFDDYWNSRLVWPIAEIVPLVDGQPVDAGDFDRWIGARAPALALPGVDLLGYAPVGQDLDAGRLALHWGAAQVIADPPTKPASMSADEALATSVTMQVWGLLLAARDEVELTSPYLVPGEKGMAAFQDLAQRKVRLTLLTNSLAANDEPLVHTGYVRYRKRLLASGASLYELSPERTRADEQFGMFGKSLGRLHSKTAVIDGRQVFVGSMNLDPRSATKNTEMGVVVDNAALAQEMLRVIEVSKTRSAYRLRLRDDGQAVEWLALDGAAETVLTDEPESTFWQRLVNRLLGPLVPETLL
ncbi:phospholipase D family protein [Pseudorhodoferax sp.]|uniref:phospholipase D family protein n=1 Tax=Pseudorhodoferax sp. TaxID=1993553 RepID=UPI002DD61CC6|nr:phospholipase D family protein [Pseudorhodoferax sp.]